MVRAQICAFAMLALGSASCASAITLPGGEGRGLIAHDPTPPDGARVWPRPALRADDSFTLLRGGQVRQRFTVAEVTEHGHTLRDDAGHRLRRDADLGNLGEWPPAGDTPLHALTPVDIRFHWPLWVGKKWRCEFADRSRDAPTILLEVAYVVEALETVVVPAGTFQALRIARTAKLLVEGERYLDRTSLSWFAPEVGFDVRQLIDGTAFELLEFVRAQR
jgi:hypothetical protein